MESNGTAKRINRLEGWMQEELDVRAAFEPQASYYAGQVNTQNPAPRGVHPIRTDADYHYRFSHEYYMIAARARHAVRNDGLVEQGINRLIANLKIGDAGLDVDTGDEALDVDLKDAWENWTEDKRACDYEGRRTFRQIVEQGYFSEVVDGDRLHLPLRDGRIQSWESHHLRGPSVGLQIVDLRTRKAIIHGCEKKNGATVAWHVADEGVKFSRRGDTLTPLSTNFNTRRYPVYDSDGNLQVFYLGSSHRFWQSRGISRLSPPRLSLAGFADLNYAHIKSALRRSLISYLMSTKDEVQGGPKRDAKVPQTGARTEKLGLELESTIVEQSGEPAQVIKAPAGWALEGWNANIPGSQFFEHASLMLTILAVNLDLPLMFLLMDGSRVNFHGGRMITDQLRMRLESIQKDQICGLYNPTYEWKVRQLITPGSRFFDRAIARKAGKSGISLFKKSGDHFGYRFRPPAWPYTKPLEDVTADKVAVDNRIRSRRRVLRRHGIDIDEERRDIFRDDLADTVAAAEAAQEFVRQYADVEGDVTKMFWHFLNPSRDARTTISLKGTFGEESESGGSDDAPV